MILQDIHACLDRLGNLEKTVEWLELDNAGLTIDVLRFAESLLDIQIYKDIKETFLRYNGLFMGLDVFRLETCILNTLQCRREYTDNKRRKKLKNSLVISNDGTGNPILISETGQLYVFYHDDLTFEVMKDSYIGVFEEHLKYLEQHQNQVAKP